jgi:hypothetical protein
MTSIPPWSFSRLKDFKTCPKKFFEIKVAKNFKEPEFTEATMYGSSFHEAAEHYIRDGTPLPQHFAYVKQHLDTLRGIEGDKYCEHEMGLTKELAPCGFKDDGVWCRGIADLLIVKGDKAWVLDYKTGKSAKYADTGQLELMSLLVFKHFPEVKKVKGGLLFVVANNFIKAAYDVAQEHVYWRGWMEDVHRLERAYETGVWNPNKNGLCKKWCYVTTCPHNGGGR